jgi:ABC-type antimicrobial peptide transport system permease subunit
MVETVRRKVHELEPQRSVFELTPLTAHISDAYAQNRLRTILLAFFAVTAIALSSVGLYGTLSYLVNIRRREVGLRLALGARRRQIVGQFVAQGLRVCLAGAAAGMAMAAAFTRLLAEMLFGVSPWDGLTAAIVLSLVFALAVVASLLPAVRAACLEPVEVLRQD